MDSVQTEPVERKRRKLPQELNILTVLIGVALVFELLGGSCRGKAFSAARSA